MTDDPMLRVATLYANDSISKSFNPASANPNHLMYRFTYVRRIYQEKKRLPMHINKLSSVKK